MGEGGWRVSLWKKNQIRGRQKVAVGKTNGAAVYVMYVCIIYDLRIYVFV